MNRANATKPDTGRRQPKQGTAFECPVCGRTVTMYVLTLRAPYCTECRQRMAPETKAHEQQREVTT